MKSKWLLFFFTVQLFSVKAQDHWNKKTGCIYEFGNVPAWAALVDLVPKDKKQVYIFDDSVYKGHSNFVLRYLKRKITFAAFKEEVKHPENRRYIPFNLYDLREKNFSCENEKYSWAIKMVDYRLQDNPEEMLKLLSETYDYVKNYLGSIDKNCGKGIILLSNSETATPNISSRDGLKKTGVPACALKEFLAQTKYNSKTNQVLNGGTVNGIVHYLSAGEEDDAVNDANAIYVFEKTPERVPLAKGFITLQPQTYLSHINLLAINRKTPNVSVGDENLAAQIKLLNGMPAKFSCDKEKNSVYIEKTELSSVHAGSNALRKKTELIAADSLVKELVDLDDIIKNTLKTVGAKAANYALLQKNFPKYVRKGSAIPFYFYKKIISRKDISEKISQLENLPDSARQQRLFLQREIRELIKNSDLPAGLTNAIKNLQNAKYKSKKIRIRSSTNCEDLPEFNGAGLYLSRGIDPDDTPDEIKKKLLTVYASMWNDNACSERRFFGIDNRQACMAILINEAYDQEFANGVSLSVPADSGKIQLVINAQPGDHAVTNPQAGDIPEEIFFPNISKKTYSNTSKSNYGKVFAGTALAKTLLEELRILTKEVDALLKMKLGAEEKNNFGTDIEFKIVLLNGKATLFVKQARLLNMGMVQ